MPIVSQELHDDILNRFAYHPPKAQNIGALHDAVRQECRSLAIGIAEMCPDSRERSIALTKIEEAMMWANAAIARHKEVGS